jgi:hypothetical protein
MRWIAYVLVALLIGAIVHGSMQRGQRLIEPSKRLPQGTIAAIAWGVGISTIGLMFGFQQWQGPTNAVKVGGIWAAVVTLYCVSLLFIGLQRRQTGSGR